MKSSVSKGNVNNGDPRGFKTLDGNKAVQNQLAIGNNPSFQTGNMNAVVKPQTFVTSFNNFLNSPSVGITSPQMVNYNQSNKAGNKQKIIFNSKNIMNEHFQNTRNSKIYAKASNIDSQPLSKNGSILAFGKSQEMWVPTQNRSPTMMSNFSRAQDSKKESQVNVVNLNKPVVRYHKGKSYMSHSIDNQQGGQTGTYNTYTMPTQMNITQMASKRNSNLNVPTNAVVSQEKKQAEKKTSSAGVQNSKQA